MATDGVEDDPDGVSFWKIKHGIRWTGMPSWKDTLSDQQIFAIRIKQLTLQPWSGLGVFCIYAAVALLAGAILLKQRDA